MSDQLTEGDWKLLFARLGAFWIHSGKPDEPHSLLTSGLHSNGHFNASRIIENPKKVENAMRDLGTLAEKHLRHPISRDTKIVGSAFGAITLAHELARQKYCEFGFTEPVYEDGIKKMRLRRFSVAQGERVLVIEDAITTGETTRETIAELETRGAAVLPLVLALCNRSSVTHLDERPILALINVPMATWMPAECPLCLQGSKAVRPKENWQHFTAAR